VLLAHPAVADVAVVARPDEQWGAVPVAIVVLADPAEVTDAALETDLAAHARSQLAAFKVPTEFHRVDAIPRTASGKLRRSEARLLIEPSWPTLPFDAGGSRAH
jgi:acyl-coenzyme A synthetase/AMP-(fatty) acid ligase